jgi:hypothetical protein
LQPDPKQVVNPILDPTYHSASQAL